MINSKRHPNIKGIESVFFELDIENKIAHIRLDFDKPSEIFDRNAVTKIPLMGEDFLSWIIRSFDSVPNDYKLDIRVFFNDLEEYREDELAEICKKNILLETVIYRRKAGRLNRLALSLCALGLVFVLASIGVNVWWDSDSIAKQIIAFIMEIAATVPFWSAVDIYFVKNGEKRRNAANFVRRFHNIAFYKKETANDSGKLLPSGQ